MTALHPAGWAAALLAVAAAPVAAQAPPPSAADAAALLEDDDARLLEESAAPPEGVPSVSLRHAVGLALERNYSLLAVDDGVAAARLRERAARSDFAPRLTPRFLRSPETSEVGFEASQRLPWTGGRMSAVGSVLTPRGGANFDRSSAFQLSLTQPLLRGFGPTVTGFEVENSRRARQAQERNLELFRQRLAVDVTFAYFQVVRQRQLVAVADQSRRRGESLRAASEARMQVGLDSRLDVLRAELQSAQATDVMISSQAALESALEQFRILLGLEPSDPLQPGGIQDLSPADVVEIEPVEILVERALQQRLELLESRDRIGDAQRSYAVAAQSLLPQLDLTLSVSRYGLGPTFGEALRGTDHRFDFGLSASYPLQQSSNRVGREVAGITLEAQKRDLRQLQLQIEAEVRAAVRNLERIEKSLELQRTAVEFARQQYRLATLRYQRGLASNFDVIDAEGSLVAARSALVGLLTDHQVARVQLLRVTGSLDVEELWR